MLSFATFATVIMYSDLFDALGGGGGNQNSSRNNNNNDEDDANNNNNSKPLLSFKAGKVDLAWQEQTGTFQVTPDTRRCQVNLNYNIHDSQLEWQWYDRRDKQVLDTIRITNPVMLKPVEVPKSQDADQKDHVYYWKLDSEWRMLWLQEKDVDAELLIEQANEILKVPNNSSNRPLESSDRDGPSRGTSSSPGVASTSSVSTTTRQVDALSSILENLGMPQGGGGASSSTRNQGNLTSSTGTTTASATAPAMSGGGTLTLADLQNAMGGMAQLQPPPQQQQIVSSSLSLSNPTPSLSEIVTSDAITSLLADANVRQRLLEQLPEGQRTEEFLEENLRSPQIQQTLRSLTAALMPDDHGSMDGYHSVLANFQLDAADGQRALAAGQSPVQAFLDCILANVEKEKATAAAATPTTMDETQEDGEEKGVGDETKATDEDDEEMKD
jgi:26S proteasome regulatory subunit N13